MSENERRLRTIAIGLIHRPDRAEHILGNAQADIVALGRSPLEDPYGPLDAGPQLRVRARGPEQYERGDVLLDGSRHYARRKRRPCTTPKRDDRRATSRLTATLFEPCTDATD